MLQGESARSLGLEAGDGLGPKRPAGTSRSYEILSGT